MRRILQVSLAAALGSCCAIGLAQQQSTPTSQALISVDSKRPVSLTPSDLEIKVDGKNAMATSVEQVQPTRLQVALLIDDGLRESVGQQLGDIKHFILGLPAGSAIFVGYMQNGTVAVAHNFTTEHEDAAAAVRIPLGSRGISASPYFCLSEFVKQWPPQPGVAHVVLMITNGVDPYNGSVSPMNQDSPYVDAAARDAQRAGVPVYSMYYTDAGMRGGAVSFSGQSYLAQVAENTGAQSFYQGMGNPVSMTPFLNDFTRFLQSSYLVTFPAPMGKDMVRLKVNTRLPKTKVYAPSEVPPPTMGEPSGR